MALQLTDLHIPLHILDHQILACKFVIIWVMIDQSAEVSKVWFTSENLINENGMHARATEACGCLLHIVQPYP